MNVTHANAGVHDAVASAFAAWSASLRWDALDESTRRATLDELLDGGIDRDAAGRLAQTVLALDRGTEITPLVHALQRTQSARAAGAL